jgi:hypothetical protein
MARAVARKKREYNLASSIRNQIQRKNDSTQRQSRYATIRHGQGAYARSS